MHIFRFSPQPLKFKQLSQHTTKQLWITYITGCTCGTQKRTTAPPTRASYS